MAENEKIALAIMRFSNAEIYYSIIRDWAILNV